MRSASALILLSLSASVAADPPTPLPDGAYLFRWKDAEFPNSMGFPVRVEIAGTEIRIVNEPRRDSRTLRCVSQAAMARLVRCA